MTGGGDVLDALIAGVNIVELDPEDDSVGYGGLPNAEGVVQLDSCCMHGPKQRAGGVAALEGVRTPSLVAQAVMEQTDHHLLVGKGAQDFAREHGLQDRGRPQHRALAQGVARVEAADDPQHYLDPEARGRRSQRRVLDSLSTTACSTREHVYGTINCDGINAKGEICGVTTTSGLAWKIPGRVGDSPILGAGLYVDGAVGAAGSTGRGEANLYNLSSFLIVEKLRRGMHPEGRRPGGAAARARQHGREAGSADRTASRTSTSPSTSSTPRASTPACRCTRRTTTTAAGRATPTAGS